MATAGDAWKRLKWYYVSNERITVIVGVLDGVIVEGPPIINTFRGQRLENLHNWMSKSVEQTFLEEIGELPNREMPL